MHYILQARSGFANFAFQKSNFCEHFTVLSSQCNIPYILEWQLVRYPRFLLSQEKSWNIPFIVLGSIKFPNKKDILTFWDSFPGQFPYHTKDVNTEAMC